MNKRSWKSQYVVLEENSKFHNTVREILATSSFFSRLRCWQEVPVFELIEGYSNKLHRYDWYIEELGIIIELHGDQHYKPMFWSGISYEQAMSNLSKQQNADSLKKFAAIENGYRYVEIPYSEHRKLNEAAFKQAIYHENS